MNSLKEKAEEAAGSLERCIRSGQYLNKTEGSKNDKNVYVSSDVLAQDIGNVVIKVSEVEKRNENWDIFQNLILKEAALGSNVMGKSIHKKYLRTKRPGEKMQFASKMESHERLKHGGYAASFVGDHTQSENKINGVKKRSDVLSDDSFMVKHIENTYDIHKKTGMFLVSDIAGPTQLIDNKPDKLQEKVKASRTHEPDDLCMILGRDTASKYATTPWNPEMDYGNNKLLTKAVKNRTRDKPIDSVNVKLASHGKQATRTARGAHERNYTNKESKSKVSASSLRMSMSETITRSKNPAGSRTIVHQSKLEQEEEKRRRMEEIATQRQKKIAERSLSKGITSKSTKGILQDRKKTGIEPTKNEKVKFQVSPPGVNKSHMSIFRSTIDRLAASRITHKLSSGEHQRKITKGSDGEIFSSDKRSRVGNKKFSIGTKISEKNKGQNASNSLPYSASKPPEKKDSTTTLSKHSSTSCVTQPSKSVRKSDNSAELCIELSVKKSISITPPGNSFDENGGISKNRNFNVPIDSQSEKLDHVKGDKVTSKALQVHENKRASSNFGQAVFGRTINSHEQRSISGAPELLATETSTPPPEIHLMVDPLPSRKKWDNAEDSLKDTKGFRKILLFGLTS